MTILFHPAPRALLRVVLCGAALLAPTLRAQDTVATAADLAARLSDALQDGSSTVRLKIESRPAAGAAKSVLQVQVKARRTKAATELVYTVLWPKERKGEAFLLRKSPDRPASGAVFTPPESLRPLTAAQMQEGVFGSDLAYEDLVENFYAWEHQALTGTETVDRVPCQILESKIGKGGRSTYARVRSWIDPKRMVPLRIEKYLASGELARRIETTRVAKDDTGRPVPASFSVQRAGKASVTDLEGSNSRHDLTHADADFTPEALKAPPGAAGKAR